MQGSTAVDKTDDVVSKDLSREEAEQTRIQQVWEELQSELGDDDRKDFTALSLGEKTAVFKLQEQGYLTVCRLKIHINKNKRGSDFVLARSGRSQ